MPRVQFQFVILARGAILCAEGREYNCLRGQVNGHKATLYFTLSNLSGHLSSLTNFAEFLAFRALSSPVLCRVPFASGYIGPGRHVGNADKSPKADRMEWAPKWTQFLITKKRFHVGTRRTSLIAPQQLKSSTSCRISEHPCLYRSNLGVRSMGAWLSIKFINVNHIHSAGLS